MARTVRKKLIAIVETPHLKRLIDLFRQCGVTGFTVLEGREGSGLGGDWTREDVLDATEMKVVLSVREASCGQISPTTCSAAGEANWISNSRSWPAWTRLDRKMTWTCR